MTNEEMVEIEELLTKTGSVTGIALLLLKQVKNYKKTVEAMKGKLDSMHIDLFEALTCGAKGGCETCAEDLKKMGRIYIEIT